MRGYARHYFHYNRAQCKAESIQETQRGYEEALLLWPENALFWSRLIRNKFLANDEEGAMGALAKAWDLVPEHPERSSTLVVRTVDRLLGRGLCVATPLRVWDDHASESGFDAAVESGAPLGARTWRLDEAPLGAGAPGDHLPERDGAWYRTRGWSPPLSGAWRVTSWHAARTRGGSAKRRPGSHRRDTGRLMVS